MSAVPYYSEAGVTLYHGNALDVLKQMPDESVDCCITSPPYYGLRDYGTARWSGGVPDCDHIYNHGTQGRTGQRADRTFTAQAVYKHECGKCGAVRVDEQLGLERTYPEYIGKLVLIFREVRRCLKAEGTCWLNLGDSFATGAGAVGDCPGGGEQGARWRGHDKSITATVKDDREGYRGTRGGSPKHSDGSLWAGQHPGPLTQMNRLTQPGLKPKDLMMIPARVAIALQDDGWYLRSDIVWAKVAPMPESVTDRPTRSHEFIFLLAKNERYYYDHEAIKEASVAGHGSGNGYKRDARLSFSDQNGARGSDEPWKPRGKNSALDKQASGRRITESVARARASGAEHDSPFGDTRNKRDVWTVNTDPFTGWGYDFAQADYVDARGIPRKVSQDCPVHGRLQPLAPQGPEGEFYGEQAASPLSDSEHTDGDPYLTHRSGGAPTTSCTVKSVEDNPYATLKENNSANRKYGPSLQREPRTLSDNSSIPTAPDSTPDSPNHEDSQTATRNSRRSRKTDHALSVSPHDSASAGTSDGIERIQRQLDDSCRDGSMPENSTLDFLTSSGREQSDTPALAVNTEHKRIQNKASTHATCTCTISQVSHFATFPPALIVPCVLAGCPVGGTILDPFSGAATTALVAKENHRKCVGIELNLDYLRISERRLSQGVLPLQEASA